MDLFNISFVRKVPVWNPSDSYYGVKTPIPYRQSLQTSL